VEVASAARVTAAGAAKAVAIVASGAEKKLKGEKVFSTFS